MVDEDACCIDVLTQISATTKALPADALELLEDHLGHCVVHAVEVGGPDATEKVPEAAAAIERLVKVMTRDRDTAGAVRAARPDRVPGCDAGPAGRVAFVARELADLWRELRGHARPTPDPDTEKDIEQ